MVVVMMATPIRMHFGECVINLLKSNSAKCIVHLHRHTTRGKREPLTAACAALYFQCQCVFLIHLEFSKKNECGWFCFIGWNTQTHKLTHEENCKAKDNTLGGGGK